MAAAGPLKLGDTANLAWIVTAADSTQTYTWRVCANNGQAEGPGADVTLKPSIPVPSQPGNLQATPVLNLIANGSFEAGTNSWTLTGNASIASSYFTDGAKCLAFNDGQTIPNAVLSQTVTTTPGATYSLNFDAGIISFSPQSQALQVTVAGSGTNQISKTFTMQPVQGQPAWQSYSLVFKADQVKATVTFRDAASGSNASDGLLDNVRMTAVP